MKTEKIYAYMVARAAYEGQGHTLTPDFYEAGFRMGVRHFFNVEMDGDGNLLRDTENPEFWDIYTNQEQEK